MVPPVLNRPIRIMHVVGVLGLAGMEYGVIKLVNRLEPEHFSPMVCVLHVQEDTARSLLDGRLPVFEMRKRPGRDWHLILRLATLLRRERVDLVHSHNWPTFFYTVIAAAVARGPIVIHGEHGHTYESLAMPRRR